MSIETAVRRIRVAALTGFGLLWFGWVVGCWIDTLSQGVHGGFPCRVCGVQCSVYYDGVRTCKRCALSQEAAAMTTAPAEYEQCLLHQTQR